MKRGSGPAARPPPLFTCSGHTRHTNHMHVTYTSHLSHAHAMSQPVALRLAPLPSRREGEGKEGRSLAAPVPATAFQQAAARDTPVARVNSRCIPSPLAPTEQAAR
eukprot:360715-Chlamydomonas_euryale.AAC.2